MSRCTLIESVHPPLDIPANNFQDLPEILRQASSSVGAMIRLGKKFTTEGIEEIATLQPKTKGILDHGPRSTKGSTILVDKIGYKANEEDRW